jgi:hypothetical protein
VGCGACGGHSRRKVDALPRVSPRPWCGAWQRPQRCGAGPRPGRGSRTRTARRSAPATDHNTGGGGGRRWLHCQGGPAAHRAQRPPHWASPIPRTRNPTHLVDVVVLIRDGQHLDVVSGRAVGVRDSWLPKVAAPHPSHRPPHLRLVDVVHLQRLREEGRGGRQGTHSLLGCEGRVRPPPSGNSDRAGRATSRVQPVGARARPPSPRRSNALACRTCASTKWPMRALAMTGTAHGRRSGGGGLGGRSAQHWWASSSAGRAVRATRPQEGRAARTGQAAPRLRDTGLARCGGMNASGAQHDRVPSEPHALRHPPCARTRWVRAPAPVLPLAPHLVRAHRPCSPVTHFLMPRIMSGSDMRATPPDARMSAGTRSSACARADAVHGWRGDRAHGAGGRHQQRGTHHHGDSARRLGDGGLGGIDHVCEAEGGGRVRHVRMRRPGGSPRGDAAESHTHVAPRSKRSPAAATIIPLATTTASGIDEIPGGWRE